MINSKYTALEEFAIECKRLADRVRANEKMREAQKDLCANQNMSYTIASSSSHSTLNLEGVPSRESTKSPQP